MRAPLGFLVAIDGPSGAGKTAAGMLLAERFDAVFVDTGIFYRAITLLAIQKGRDTSREEALTDLVPAVSSVVVARPGGCRVADVRVSGKSVGEEIRTAEIDAHVPRVAAHSHLRDALLALQRGAAQGAAAVVAGRDIGTVVFPEAPVKFFLDASVEERAARRVRQFGSSGGTPAVAASITIRDTLDSQRAVSPLACATDARIVNTDNLTLVEVVELLVSAVESRIGAAGGHP